MPIYIFHRKSGFEPVNTPNSESQVITHGSTDPTVLKIEFAPTGRIVWEREPKPKFKIGDRVRKVKGSQWSGKVVGTYSTELTPEGFCVESESHKNAVQIYPGSALEANA